MKKVSIFSLLLILISGCATAEYAGELTQQQALARIAKQDILVLDVRSPEEFGEGHVPTAINIPFNEIEEQQDRLAAYKDKDILIYCRSGRRAGWAQSTLDKLGFKRVYHLQGDMNAWYESKLKIEQ